MGCRRPLNMEDRAVVGAGLESGLCQARIARMLGRSPSVIRGGIKRNAGTDGRYRGEEAGRMAARRRARPKERALEADPVLRARALPGPGVRAPCWISGRLKAEARSGVGRHVLAPQQPMGARSATRRSTRGSTRHRGKGPRKTRDRAALTALGAQEGLVGGL